MDKTSYFVLFYSNSYHIIPDDTAKEAFVTILPHLNGNSITGNLKISQNTPTSPLVIKGSIEGLMPGKHGIHIHQLKIEGNDCTTSGGHFNPGNVRFKKIFLFTYLIISNLYLLFVKNISDSTWQS